MAKPAKISKLSPQRAFREQLRNFIDEHGDIPAPEMARRFTSQLDPSLLQEWATAEAQTMVVFYTRQQFARDRVMGFRVSNWEVYREYVPGFGHKRLLKMTRREAEAALNFRMRVVIGNILPAELLRRVIAQMQSDDAVIENHFTEEALTGLLGTIRKEMSRGNFRVSVKPAAALPSNARVPQQDLRRRAK